jgi:hypothetical protein
MAKVSITRGETFSEQRVVKLAFLFLGGMLGIAAAGLGFVPLWAIAPFAAGGLLIWGVIEYLADRPMGTVGEEVKHT